MYVIKIEKVADVYCVKVGCQRFFYFTETALIADLDFYLHAKDGDTEKRYFDAKEVIDAGSKAQEAPIPGAGRPMTATEMAARQEAAERARRAVTEEEQPKSEF